MSSHKPRRSASQDRSYRPPVRPHRDLSSRRRLKDTRVYSSFDSSGPRSRCYGPPPPPPGPPPPPPGPPPPPPPPPHQVQVYGQYGSGGSDSSSPAPSLSSGYLSTYSQDWEEDVWQRPESRADFYTNMAELNLETRPRSRVFRHSDIENCVELESLARRQDDLWSRRVRHVQCQTQPLLPSPYLLPQDTYYDMRPRDGWRPDRRDRPFGCCNKAVSLLPRNRVQFQAETRSREEREDRGQSDEHNQSKIKNFFTWVSSKAGESTNALLDSFPLKGGGKFVHVIMIGLDGAGKTTALYMMKLDQYLDTVPTIGFNCERVKGSLGSSSGTTFLVWDVGGQEKIRPLWRTYTRNTDGIIFILDCSDYRSFDQARVELHRTLGCQDKEDPTPLLIMANKQDLPMALNERQVVTTLSLKQLGREQQWGIVLTCAKTGQGLDTGLEMLHMMIVKKKMMKKRIRNKTK